MSNEAGPLKFIEDPLAPSCENGHCTLPIDRPKNPLFSAASVAGMELKNRFALAPMSLQRSPGGVPTEEMANYYAHRAAGGGAGLIITETTAIDHVSVGRHLPQMPRLVRGIGESGHARIAESVQAEGSKVFVQLFHPGATDMAPLDNNLIRSPSGIYGLPSIRRGKSADQREISEIINAFADAARLADDLGYDGVEVHGAHGYLVDQFLWAVTNRRDDLYGGSSSNRARFAEEVVARIRQKTRSSFRIGFRISQWKSGVRGGGLVNNPAELEALITPISQAGVDVFHVSVRDFNEVAFPGSDLTLAGWVRSITRKPVITVGSVGFDENERLDYAYDFSKLNSRFAAGEYDLVAVGRALLLDPYWLSRQSPNSLGEGTHL